MPQTLAEFVREHRLCPGQSLRERVNGFTVELRVLRDDDEPSPEFAEQVMLNVPSYDPPREGRLFEAVTGPAPWPDPPVIDEWDRE